MICVAPVGWGGGGGGGRICDEGAAGTVLYSLVFFIFTFTSGVQLHGRTG